MEVGWMGLMVVAFWGEIQCSWRGERVRRRERGIKDSGRMEEEGDFDLKWSKLFQNLHNSYFFFLLTFLCTD
jgi:hypothetical protein